MMYDTLSLHQVVQESTKQTYLSVYYTSWHYEINLLQDDVQKTEDELRWFKAQDEQGLLELLQYWQQDILTVQNKHSKYDKIFKNKHLSSNNKTTLLLYMMVKMNMKSLHLPLSDHSIVFGHNYSKRVVSPTKIRLSCYLDDEHNQLVEVLYHKQVLTIVHSIRPSIWMKRFLKN